MASKALDDLKRGVGEVSDLLSADPTPAGGISPKPAVTRAVIRSAVVILTSHLERYVYAVTEQAVHIVTQKSVPRDKLELKLKLQHTRVALDEISEINWLNRGSKLEELMVSDGWLWQDSSPSLLDHKKLLRWMKTPSPNSLKKLYALWGIDDIFHRVARKQSIRGQFFLHIRELVEKRNNIAHGDFTAESTRYDVESYSKTVDKFCSRADRALARAIQVKLKVDRPW